MKQSQKSTPKSRVTFPWWIYVFFAVVLYLSLKYAFPLLFPENSALAKVGKGAPSFAPIITILLLLLGANSLYASSPDNKEEESQASEEG